MRRLAKPLGRKAHVGSNPTPSAFARRSLDLAEKPGGMAEWLNALLLKSSMAERPSGVRIPLPPP